MHKCDGNMPTNTVIWTEKCCQFRLIKSSYELDNQPTVVQKHACMYKVIFTIRDSYIDYRIGLIAGLNEVHFNRN